MKMDIRKALAGVLPDKNAKKRLLEKQSMAANDLRGLLLHKNWSSMQRILDGFKSDAVRELGKNGMELRDWMRINHRFELLMEIDSIINTTLDVGTQADGLLSKMKEKSDGR